jgi:rhamnose utilization protein RhaD (predicted bifunctional aldolase and dehydrogenase)/NAD(P)-dependent dehydrogenase (short-subunit alcohol dehydrogenase family)
MQNLWQESDARQYKDDLSQRVYSSRLLGQNKSLVLHGGGNTSVKIKQANIFGEDEEVLYVKGSGWDLETIEAAGYAPVQMSHLLKLAKLKAMTDSQMVNELKTHMLDAKAPTPSVETILHALLPYKYVDHTHADAIISITNTPSGKQRIKELYGDSVVIIPYIMPGFDLSLLCENIFPSEKNPNTIGMVLLNHGIFSFGSTAKESYDRMIELVEKAEQYLQKNNAWNIPKISSSSSTSIFPAIEVAQLRKKLSNTINQALIIKNYQSTDITTFCQHKDLNRISQQGPATPDHVIRTKQLAMLINLEDKSIEKKNIDDTITNYSDNYYSYFKQYTDPSLTILDKLPRVILDPINGLFSVGKSVKEANIIADIYQHTMKIIQQSELLESYQALPSKDIFDVEYWELEQAKLKCSSSLPEFSGEIALVTGAASGIGKACVDSLLQRGAAVVGIDIKPSIMELYSQRADFLGIQCDLTNEQAIAQSISQVIKSFGGLDILILNAGIFPSGCKVKDLNLKHWQKVIHINLDANVSLLSQTHPFLSLAPNGGRVAVIGSKNVPAPGPGAAAYSASKAALNQLVRVTAMEWGEDNIRINSVHPNAVFDTAIWTDEILQSRAKHYGLTIEEYKTNNILKTTISSHDVAELTVSLCGSLFAKTTAAQIPIDGGNDRVI